MIVFVEVKLTDASNFVNEPVIDIHQEEGRYVAENHRRGEHRPHPRRGGAGNGQGRPAAGNPLRLDRPDAVVRHPRVSLFGEGNVPWMVRELIRTAEPDEAKRPLIIIAGA